MAYRNGRFSKEEIDLIYKNADKLTATEIAQKLNRNPDAVRNLIKREGLNLKSLENHKEYAESSLVNSDHWKVIKDRYSEDEQDYVITAFAGIMTQFQNDVQYTEMLQILDFIHLDIEINRAATLKKELMDGINSLKQRLRTIVGNFISNQDEVLEFENIISSKEKTLKDIGVETVNFLKQKQSIQEKMKATRDQRVTRIEASKKTLNGFIIDLLSNPEKMRRVGLDIEKHRIATDYEVIRLSELYEYSDGGVDPIMLTADSVMEIEGKD